MKIMTVFEAKNHFSRALRAAARDVVIVTRRGKPVAAIQKVTEEDLEDYLLERSEKFWAMIERARKGKGLSIEAVRKDIRG
jgi:prevent-host-death family protein